ATTQGDDWRMRVEPVSDGLRVIAFDGAQPFVLLAEAAEARPAHEWYRGFRLAAEEARGLDALEDHLPVGTLRLYLEPTGTRTIVLSCEPAPSLDGDAAWARRQRHEGSLLARFDRIHSTAASAPAWIRQLVLAADQFVVRRPLPDDSEGMSIL